MELISREEVRKCFNGTITTSESNIDSIKEYLQKVCTKIEELPTIESRPTGKWKRISVARIYECSVCGANAMTNDIAYYAFCHHCGAEMESE